MSSPSKKRRPSIHRVALKVDYKKRKQQSKPKEKATKKSAECMLVFNINVRLQFS